MPGYVTWDFGARYQLNNRMSLNLNLYNAFDRTYPISSYNSGTQWILGQPRAVEIAFHGRF
jgi:iron complex outermembrane receptor protein